MADSVQLTDLDVITLYSIAVRSATADRDELIAILRADLAWLEAGGESRPPVAREQIEFEDVDESPTDSVEDEYDEPGDSEAQPELDREIGSADSEPEPVAEVAAPKARAPIRRMAVTITPPARKTAVKKTAAKHAVAKKTSAKKAAKKSASARGRS
jgi:hypothetical protein